MLIDARTILADEVIETEVCIVGAGPAGITLAREFQGQNVPVCLLESGGLEADAETQSLNKGAIASGHQYPSDELHAGRYRQFGGSANLWCIQVDPSEGISNVRHIIPDGIDFEKRDWLPYSGWPVSRADLLPFYERAHAVCKIGPLAYDAQTWETGATGKLPLKGERITTGVFQFGPRAVFTDEYREEIQRADNITTYLNANVVEIETNETACTVTRLHVATLSGITFSIRAKVFILATGGFENARLLLLSNQQQKGGLGNQNDLVGRFFMDHPGFRCGVLIPTSPQLFSAAGFYDLHRVNGIPIMGKLALAQEVLRQECVLNICAMLVPRPSGYESKAVNAFRALLRSGRHAKLPQDALKLLSNLTANLDDVLMYAARRALKSEFSYSPRYGGWSRLLNKPKFKVFEVIAQAEQAPNPSNRVALSGERDRLGRQKVQLHWQWSEIDLRSIERFQAILGEEIERAGLGRFESRQEVEGSDRPRFGSTHHHMGTTRMHPDPKQGVVDENCQVHGISNLFIAGSSVFPTGGGYANPTLTIVALAARLADHLKKVLTSPNLGG